MQRLVRMKEEGTSNSDSTTKSKDIAAIRRNEEGRFEPSCWQQEQENIRRPSTGCYRAPFDFNRNRSKENLNGLIAITGRTHRYASAISLYESSSVTDPVMNQSLQ